MEGESGNTHSGAGFTSCVPQPTIIKADTAAIAANLVFIATLLSLWFCCGGFVTRAEKS
jgi:hypothetical protein